MNSIFEQFINELKSNGYVISEESISDEMKNEIGQIWQNTINFLEDSKLVSSVENLDDFSNNVKTVNLELPQIGHQRIFDYVKSCGVPEQYIVPTAEAIALCIHKYNSSNIAYDHFSNEKPEGIMGNDIELKDIAGMYSDKVINNNYFDKPTLAFESFGVNIDKTITDVRLAIAITVLKFGKGILPRLIPNRPTDSTIALYKVDRVEAYDFNKSSDPSAKVRYEGDHIIPFIELHKDPSGVDMSTIPVIVKESNDTSNDYVLEDGYLNVSKKANLFDLAKDSSIPGFDYVDYTDLLSEGGKVKSLVLKLVYTDGTNNYTEYFEYDVQEVPGARFTMMANASDAADRFCSFDTQFVLTSTSTTRSGTTSQFASGLDTNTVIRLDVSVNGSLNLRTSFVNVLASLEKSLDTLDGTTPTAAMQTLFNNIVSLDVIAYSLDVSYSEENFRKTTLAAVIRTKMVGYEIKGTKNVLLSMSHKQTAKDLVISKLNELIRIGNDYRGVKMILDAMNRVYNAVKAEEATNVPTNKRIFNNYVAGYKCKPYIYIGDINIGAEVQSMRSAEALGDVRGLFEKKLLEILTLIYNQSYFIQALNPGQRPVFKVLTSGYILDAGLNVPYYKTINDQPDAEKAGDDVVEYRRMLPNGTELQVITTTWDMMSDKMILVPYIPNSPDSELNFGHLWDNGVFVAQITPYINRASFKEIIANQREMPIITNPIGAYITVKGLSNVFTGIGDL